MNETRTSEAAPARGREFPKTDARFWRKRLFTRSNDELQVRIGFGGRQDRWPLRTANSEQAALKARDIYVSLNKVGFEATRARFKPWEVEPVEEAHSPTVGQYIEAAQAVAQCRPVTLTHYARKFRFLVANMLALKSGRSKFDPVNGFKKHRAKVDSVPLDRITPEAVAQWRVRYIAAAGNPIKQNAARATAASIIRNAKALFAPDIVEHVKLPLPSPLPLENVKVGKIPRARYQSRVNAHALARDAYNELKDSNPEAFKVFLLAFGAGLRRGEIDKVLWRQFDFEAQTLILEANEYGGVKTEGSADTIDLSPEVSDYFREQMAKSQTEFVISSRVDPEAHSTHWHHYRAVGHFKELTDWLRAKGVTARNPIHLLRKEFGSLINQRFGIFAASVALRHSNISVTREHYVDRKERIALDVGELLNGKAAS